MIRSPLAKKLWALLLTLVTVLLWTILLFVFLERYPPPLERLELLLMPWKAPLPDEGGLDQRLAFMQSSLNASARISRAALAVTILSFAALTMYLSVLYQQRQRRSRENMLLVLKNQEIARRNEFIRYISATISHEFKNNLGRIKRRIDLLSDLPSDARERIDGNLEKLFADIDIFKRISDEREAGLIEFQHIDLRAVLQELARQYGDLAEITIEEERYLPPITAAPQLIRSVFENLFDNAIKYKRPDQDRARVLVACSRDQDGGRQYVTISVRDEGLGMDEQQSEQCFYKGKGIGDSWGQGLYYTKYVVGLHAGKVRVGTDYTAPGKGSEFIIKLPHIEEISDV